MKLILVRIGSLCSLLLAAALMFGGCATSSDPAFTSAPDIQASGNLGGPVSTNPLSPSSSQDYRFQIGDMVVVVFSGTPEPPPPHQERIKEDGSITLPLIGSVKAAGKTAGELQAQIHGSYVPKYYVRLTVTVSPTNQELFYHVTGEVRSPGPKLHLKDTTITKAISSAGGFTEFARKGKLELTRANGTKATVDYNKASERPELDLKVMPGDRINVRRRIL